MNCKNKSEKLMEICVWEGLENYKATIKMSIFRIV